MTYDEMIAVSRRLASQGRTEDARRVAQVAVDTRRGAMNRNPSAGADPRASSPVGAMPAAPPAATDIPPAMASRMAALLTPEGQAARRAEPEQGYDANGLPIPAPGDVPAFAGAARVAAGEGVMPMAPGAPLPENPEGRAWLGSWRDDGNPETFSRGEQMREAGLRSLESLTFGLAGDEFAAGVGSVLGRGSYDDNLAHRQEQARLYQEQFPVDALAADLAPMAVPGLGAAKFVMQGATRGAQLARSAAVGAAGGATYGAMEGDEREGGRAAGARNGLIAGAAFGFALPAAAGTLQGLPRAVGRLARVAQERPSVQVLQSLKTAAYTAAQQAGHTFSPQELGGLVNNVRSMFGARHYVASEDTAARAALRTLEVNANRPLTLSELDTIRQSLWTRYQSAKNQPMILDAIHAIDSLVDNQAGASALMQTAREANRVFRNSQLLDDAMTRATDQTASTGTGGNILNKMRQAVTSIINDPDRARFFNESEIAVMRGFVRGTVPENTLRQLGRLAPNGNGLMMALHVTGGVLSQGATLPVMVGGAAAKAAADGLARLRMSNVQDVVAGVRPASAGVSPGAAALGVMTAPAIESARSAGQSALTPPSKEPCADRGEKAGSLPPVR